LAPDSGFRILRDDRLADAEDLKPAFLEAIAVNGRRRSALA